jgi:hypothetical protein
LPATNHIPSPARFETRTATNQEPQERNISAQRFDNTRPTPTPKRSFRTKKYLQHYPVTSLHEAKVLSKPSSWEILDVVRAAGVNGISASDIIKVLNLPQSDVYATLKELLEIQSIAQLPKDMKPKDERKRLYVYERTTLRKYDVDKRVALVTRELYEGNELESLRVPFFAMLAMVHDELQSRGHDDALPTKAEEWFCQQCEANHQAVEFFQAVAIAIIRTLMDDSSHFKRLLSRLGYLNNVQHS